MSAIPVARVTNPARISDTQVGESPALLDLGLPQGVEDASVAAQLPDHVVARWLGALGHAREGTGGRAMQGHFRGTCGRPGARPRRAGPIRCPTSDRPRSRGAPAGGRDVRGGGSVAYRSSAAARSTRRWKLSPTFPPSIADSSVPSTATAARIMPVVVTSARLVGSVGSETRLSTSYCAPTNAATTVSTIVATTPTTHDRKPLRAPSNRASRPAT